MSSSTGAASLRSWHSHRPSTSYQSQGPGHGDDEEDIALEQLSQRLLQHQFRNQNEGTTSGTGQPASHDGEVRPASTSSSDSRGSSVISYDSLEESPTHESDQMQSPPVTKPDKKLKANLCSCLPTTIWKMEILSSVIAALCLAAIIVILYMYQGLPLPQWPNKITINALISVFTAIFKMALTMPIAEGK